MNRQFPPKKPSTERIMLESRTPEDRLVPNTNLKLGNKKKSVFDSQREVREKFEQRVEEIQENHTDSFSKAIYLGKRFAEVINNKTLLENKGPMEKSLEKEILKEWQSYILQQNNPPDEDLFNTPEGAGSLSAILMIFSTLIKFRDRANKAEYRSELLEERVLQLETQMNNLITHISSESEDTSSEG